MLHLDNAENRRIGIGLVTLTTLCFAVLDTSAKWLVQTLPVLQVVWLRFVFHVLIASALLAPRYGLGTSGRCSTCSWPRPARSSSRCRC
ncbi:MAG: hypothetical protein MUF16_14195 [Burkholderiaceae bacterium]|nr:hypothetical protein [Burkholderiaceae bacterium]